MKEPQVEKNDYPTVPAAIIVGEGREFRDDYTFVIVKSGDNLDTGVFTNDPQAVVALYQNGLAGIEKHIPPVGTKRVLIADDAKGLGGLRIDTQADYEHKVHITILELNADGTIIIHHSDPAELKFVGKPVIVGVEIPDKLDTTGNSNHEFDEVIHELNWDSRASYSLISALREELYQLGFRFDQSTDRTFERLYAQFSLPFEFKRRIDQRREYASEHGIYLPHVELLFEGNYPPRQMNDMFAQGKYPVGAADLHYLAHDLTSEHFEALMVYGEPLMDFLMFTNRASQEIDEFDFLHIYDGENTIYSGGHYTGEDKELRVSLINEFVTFDFASLFHLDKPFAEQSKSSFLGRLEIVINDALNLLRHNHTLQDTLVAKSLLAKAVPIDKITAADIIGEIFEQAQTRHNIEVLPTHQRTDQPIHQEWGDNDEPLT